MFDPNDLMLTEDAKVVGHRNPCCVITNEELHVKHIERMNSRWMSFPRRAIVDVEAEGVMDFRKLRLLMEDGSDVTVNVDKRYFDDIFFSLKNVC